MSNIQEQGSEVARLLQQIREEFEAAKLGLSGLAQGVGKHQFITHRMERMGECHEKLRDLVGEDAMALIVEQLASVPDTVSPSTQ